jgi:DNA adenine methylase
MHKPIIPWIGGKRRLAKQLLPMFPDHTCYVEPFCGAAALFFLKPISKAEVINDLNSDLVCLYRVVQHHLDEFVRQFRWALASRELFKWLQDTPPHTLTDIQRAARFYYLQRTCFGGKVNGRTFGADPSGPPRLNLLRLEEDLSQAHLRLAQATIEHLPWEECIYKYDRPTTFFYLDPPYWQTEGYGVSFPWEEYEQLAASMRRLKGKAILSINDHPAIREAFSGLPMQSVGINYTVGGGRHGRESRELIIRS